jgi:putative heme-binding domain-containing protein
VTRSVGAALFLLAAVLAAGVGPSDSAAVAQQPKKDTPKKKAAPKKREVAQPHELYVAPGFKAELLYVAEPDDEGSWINLCAEKPNRLVVGGQGGQPILRFTLKDGKVERVDKLPIPISETMGLLYAFDHLYVTGAGPKGYGLYKCKEKADGSFDVRPLKIFGAGGEHGAHAVVLGKDGMLYVMNGNHTNVPDGLSPASALRNYAEDHLLARAPDGNGHATGRMAPGGYVLRTDPDGKTWEMVLGGFRNAYDMAFNPDGELFTFDSDMEWDWGMPWYRPTRINHCVSGADFGWRYGSGVWPDYYPDSLPTTLDIGIGSPTGVTNGTGAAFPARYQKAVFICDWTYGRLMAVHLTPNGSSYSATFENFVCPLGLVKPGTPKKPLNLTDAVVGSDGAMYFTTGGRNSQAALYRVTYTGPANGTPAKLENAEGAEARALRRSLEAFHGKADPKAVAAAWPHLGSQDRFLRNAARVAVEWQPVASWKAKALAETEPQAALTALVALARSADAKAQPEILAALDKLPLAKLTADQKIEKFRALQLTFIRQGPPAGGTKKLIAELEAGFPGPDERINREAFQLMVYLNAPGVVTKGLARMAAAKSQEDLFHDLFYLRNVPVGSWTMDQRKTYLGYWTKRPAFPPPADVKKWFDEGGRGYANGNSFNNFLKNFLRDNVAAMSPAEQKALAPTVAAINKDITPNFEVKARPVVKAWKAEEFTTLLGDGFDKGRSFDRGREAYAAAQCIKCHRFGDTGGAVGPDLTAISSRFGRREILESILEPSKTLSDQYQNEIFTTASGKSVTGRVVDETKETIAVQPDPLAPDRVVIRKDDLESRTASKLSPMPANLADVLTRDEVLDLIAYMESGGRRNHPVFGKR